MVGRKVEDKPLRDCGLQRFAACDVDTLLLDRIRNHSGRETNIMCTREKGQHHLQAPLGYRDGQAVSKVATLEFASSNQSDNTSVRLSRLTLGADCNIDQLFTLWLLCRHSILYHAHVNLLLGFSYIAGKVRNKCVDLIEAKASLLLDTGVVNIVHLRNRLGQISDGSIQRARAVTLRMGTGR